MRDQAARCHSQAELLSNDDQHAGHSSCAASQAEHCN
jgi:hypothetical protein